MLRGGYDAADVTMFLLLHRKNTAVIERRLDDLVERDGIYWSLDFLPCDLMPQPELMDTDRDLAWSSDSDANGEDNDEDDDDEPEPPTDALTVVVHPAEDLAHPAPCVACATSNKLCDVAHHGATAVGASAPLISCRLFARPQPWGAEP